MDITTQDTTNREIITERTFHYPREMVFAAWTDPARVAIWWGPNGFTTTIHSMDVRPGGVWKFTMHGPDGTDYPNQVTYIEVAKPVRLEWMHGDGINPERDFHNTITFTERGHSTDVKMHAVFDSPETLEAVKKFGAVEGGRQTLECLDAYLAGSGHPDIEFTDVVDTTF